jgi:hypothetical protein
MDLVRSGPAPQRAQRYLEQAEKLRDLAGGESVAKIRDMLLYAAEQYQQLAENVMQPWRAE